MRKYLCKEYLMCYNRANITIQEYNNYSKNVLLAECGSIYLQSQESEAILVYIIGSSRIVRVREPVSKKKGFTVLNFQLLNCKYSSHNYHTVLIYYKIIEMLHYNRLAISTSNISLNQEDDQIYSTPLLEYLRYLTQTRW